jgi:hypothetical protein
MISSQHFYFVTLVIQITKDAIVIIKMVPGLGEKKPTTTK